MNVIQQVDTTILLWIQENLRAGWMNGFWKLITTLGNSGMVWIVIDLCLIISKKTRPVGVTALLSLAVCFIATNVVLKHLVARPRPFDEISTIFPLIKKPTDFSFPSGHTCASFASAFIYFEMLPKRYGVGALILAALIAFSRLYLGVHYPSDILGGILVAGIGSIVVFLFMKAMFLQQSENQTWRFAMKRNRR